MMKIRLQGLLKLIAAGVTVLVGYYSSKIYLQRRKYRHIPGPKTKGLIGFYLGNLPEFNESIKEGKIFPDKLLEWHEKYGPTFKFQFSNEIHILTTDRDAVKEILVTKNYPKPLKLANNAMFPYNQRFLGYGISSDFDVKRWRHRRSLLNQGFHRDMLKKFIEHFNTKADILMEKLTKLADSKTPVNLLNQMNQMTFDAIALIAFGMNLDTINGKDTKLSESIAECLRIINDYSIDPVANINPSKKEEKRRFMEIANYLRNKGREIILERINMLKKNETSLTNDILTIVLNTWRETEIDIEIMIDDFITFFIAGQETTATALGFSFLEIGKNDDILKKAQNEINDVLGERNEIKYEDITKLKYCSCIFKEALRLYPPGPVLIRFIDEENTISQFKIPKNTTVWLSPYISGRCEAYFVNPYEFKPERFLSDSDTLENPIESYTYFPFGLGARNCIGQNFARIEGILMIAKFIQRFDFKLDPSQAMNIEQKITIRPAGGARSFLTLRN